MLNVFLIDLLHLGLRNRLKHWGGGFLGFLDLHVIDGKTKLDHAEDTSSKIRGIVKREARGEH